MEEKGARIMQAIMVSAGFFEHRTVHQSMKHPQTGWVRYQGHKHRVFRGFWGDCPIWKLVSGPGEEQAYHYCRQKTMPIEQDPDYCGSGMHDGRKR
jgi:hypothetical protein